MVNGDSVLVDDIEGRKDGKLISLTTDQAVKYGMDGSAETIDALIDTLGYGSVKVIENSENWSENIVRF